MSGTLRAAGDPVLEPLVRPLEPDLLAELTSQVDEQGQVTVHCRFENAGFNLIRIWRSTYLVCRNTGHRSELLHAEGIVVAPLWMPVPPGGTANFTLVFAPLPSCCTVFDLIEVVPQEGGFLVSGILRNARDLYAVTV